MDNYILAYYQQIMDGSVVVGRWIRLIYEYIVHGLERKEFYYDPKRADHAISWIETHCFHTEGDLAPGPLQLELWQKAALACMFGIVDENGLRQFREIFWVLSRKQGKSLLASAVGRYIWCNDGFGARVYCVAPKLDQAEIVYNNVWTMTQLDPEWQEKEALRKERDAHKRRLNEDDPTQEKHRQTDLIIPATNSTFKKIAFSAKRSDGFNPSLTILDEVAAWEGVAGNRQYEVIKSGMGARKEPMMLSISTAGYVSDGPYDELMKRSTAFLLGSSKERRLLPFIYQIDDVENWNDINELRKSNPNLGVSVSVDYLLEEIAIAEQSLSKKAEFMCKYCCVKQNSSQAWLDAQTVEKTVSEPLRLEDFRNTYAVMGIDLSRTTDLTCATLVIERDGILNVFARFYLPREKIEEATARDNVPYRAYIQRGLLFESGDNFVDYHDVVNWVRELIVDLKIYPLMVGYDRYSASYMVQELKDGGVRMDDVFQGTNLTPIIRTVEGLMKDGKIRIGDNDLLKIHFLNSALKMDAENERVKLIKISQTAHVDGMAAFLDAMTVRDKWWPEIGAQLLNERRH
ncbi:MAG: terminase large subunit [Eubacterium sp.]|nr:terminase large subunit [Eubacterium sp.]